MKNKYTTSKELTKQEKRHIDEILDYISETVEKNDPDYQTIVYTGLDKYFSNLKYIASKKDRTEEQIFAAKEMSLWAALKETEDCIFLFSLTKGETEPYPTYGYFETIERIENRKRNSSKTND